MRCVVITFENFIWKLQHTYVVIICQIRCPLALFVPTHLRLHKLMIIVIFSKLYYCFVQFTNELGLYGFRRTYTLHSCICWSSNAHCHSVWLRPTRKGHARLFCKKNIKKIFGILSRIILCTTQWARHSTIARPNTTTHGTHKLQLLLVPRRLFILYAPRSITITVYVHAYTDLTHLT